MWGHYGKVANSLTSDQSLIPSTLRDATRIKKVVPAVNGVISFSYSKFLEFGAVPTSAVGSENVFLNDLESESGNVHDRIICQVYLCADSNVERVGAPAS